MWVGALARFQAENHYSKSIEKEVALGHCPLRRAQHMREDRFTADWAGQPAGNDQFLRLDAVRSRTGLGRSTIYRLIAASRFPRPVQLSDRAVGWRKSDLDRWSASRLPATAMRRV